MGSRGPNLDPKPRTTLSMFTGLAHHFSNVTFDAPELDEQLGLRGLHRVSPRVAPNVRETMRPGDLRARCRNGIRCSNIDAIQRPVVLHKIARKMQSRYRALSMSGASAAENQHRRSGRAK